MRLTEFRSLKLEDCCPTPIAWHDSLATGVDAIDRDHQQLLALLSGACEAYLDGAPQQHIVGLLEHLLEAELAHHQKERAVLKSLGCPDLAEHEAVHDGIDQQLLGFKLRPVVFEDYQEIGKLLTCIKMAAVGHIITYDLRILEHLPRTTYSLR